MDDKRTGEPITCASPLAGRLYEEAIDRLLGALGGVGARLDRALELEPGFPLAAIARCLVASDEREPEVAARSLAVALEGLVRVNDWEARHIRALVALSEERADAEVIAREHIGRTRGDLVVISQLAGHLFFYGGASKRRAVLELLESVETACSDDWAYLARLGFAASEIGEHRRARALLTRALELEPSSLYTIHGLAHVLHDIGDVEASATLLESWLRVHGYAAEGGRLLSHVHWHLAVSEWRMGRHDESDARYRAHCAPDVTTCGPVLALADCAGFLLRQHRPGDPAARRDPSVYALIDQVWGRVHHPFVALHVAAIFASMGDDDGLRRCADAIAGAGRSADRDLAELLVTAVSHYAAGRFHRCDRLLARLAPSQRVAVGGSNAERELIDLVHQRAEEALTSSVEVSHVG